MTANKHENVGIAPDGVKICEAMRAMNGILNLMCHPETAGAAGRTRTARQTDDMAAEEGF